MWRPEPRSAEAQALHAAAEADRAANPGRYELDPNALSAAGLARAEVELPDDWREGFQAYLASAAAEGQLNALGLRNVAGTAIGRLRARASIEKVLAQRLEIRARRIDRPIFVIGGWRTGTTLLQRLLGALPGLRPAFPAELTAPWRFAGLDTAGREALLNAGETAHAMLHTLNPAMAAIHPSGGRLAEECVLAMGTDFRNWGFTSTLRCPSYADWLLTQDLTVSYRLYADILRLLQDDSGRRWILKAPAHTAGLAALMAVFPDALIVHLHRDMVQTVTSGASLFAVFRSTYSDAVDAAEVGRYQLEMTQAWIDRALAARDANPAARVLDINFPDLAADPIATAKAIVRAADLSWTGESDEAAAAQLVALNRQHGAHKYAPADFGLDPDEVQARFAGYRSRFGLA